MQSTKPVEPFDSGLVTGNDEFPLMDVTISIHGMSCIDGRLPEAAVDRIHAIGRSWPGCIDLIGACSQSHAFRNFLAR